jgi:DNA-binding beta-propeller fold protein YncE
MDSIVKLVGVLKNSYSKHASWSISFVVTIVVVVVSICLSLAPMLLINDVKASTSNSFANATKYELVNQWGEEGDGDGQFHRPHDLDFSPSEDKLYIIDRDNQRVQVFDKNGTFLFKWGEEGDGDGEFKLPYGLDVDREGNVWVADRSNNNIQKFDAEGNFLFRFGSTGSEPGQFENLRHVAVDNASEYVYTADSNNHRIQKFDINGTFIKSFGTLGNASGQLNVPTSIVIDSKGYLYVTERGNLTPRATLF